MISARSTAGWDRLLAVLLFCGAVFWLLAGEGSEGIGRDEAQYFRAAEHYWQWFDDLGTNIKNGHTRASFTRAAIDRFWGDNPEHPPVMKVLYGFSWRLFHGPDPIGGRPVAVPLFPRQSTAFRFPAILMAGLGVVLMFRFARQFMPSVPATAAAVLALAQPHYFFHAQIACFDAPITVMAVAVGFAYWKSLRSPLWGLLCGPIFGIALGVKHNAWLMPVFLVAHYLWMRRGDLRRWRLPPIPLAFLSMLIVGPLVLYALWPYLWVDPVGRVRWYVQRHLNHEHYHFEYLGLIWNNPPTDVDLKLVRMTFPFLSTLLTVPVTTLALFACGAGTLLARWRDQRDLAKPDLPVATRPSWLRPGADVDRAMGMFFLLQILGPLSVLALPSAPIFGGVKHFMTAMPYLAIVAGLGLHALIQVVERGWSWGGRRQLVPALAALLVALPAVAETRRSQPDGLSHYNLLAGGFAGGASLGMNRQFWGYSVLPMLDWLWAHRPPGGRIYWHDVMPDAVFDYMRDLRIPPPGFGNSGGGEEGIMRSDEAMIIHERHQALYEGAIWTSYGTTRPVYVRTREGVPLVTVYRRPGTGQP